MTRAETIQAVKAANPKFFDQATTRLFKDRGYNWRTRDKILLITHRMPLDYGRWMMRSSRFTWDENLKLKAVKEAY